MERPVKDIHHQPERGPSNVLAFAVMVGFFCFLVAGASPGGLNDVEGFLTGFLSVIFLHVFMAMLEGRAQRWTATHQLHTQAGVSITQTENENGVTIQIFVSKPLAEPRNLQ